MAFLLSDAAVEVRRRLELSAWLMIPDQMAPTRWTAQMLDEPLRLGDSVCIPGNWLFSLFRPSVRHFLLQSAKQPVSRIWQHDNHGRNDSTKPEAGYTK